MMNLEEQIILIIYSFLFGFLFSFFLNLNYKYVMKLNHFLKVLSIFLIVFNSSLLYFLGIRYINHAIFHPYSVLCIIIGSTFEIILQKNVKIRKVDKKRT